MPDSLETIGRLSVGIAGYGNLGSSIARGLLRGGFPKERLLVSCAGGEASRARASRDGLADRLTDTASLAMSSDIMMVFARPQDLPSFVGVERKHGSLAVSFMAGVSLAMVRRVFGPLSIRGMASDPESNDEGHGFSTTWEPDERVEAVLAAAQTKVWRVASEDELDAVCVGICLPPVLLHIKTPDEEVAASFAQMRARYPMYEAVEELARHVGRTREPIGLERVATKGGVTEVVASTLRGGAGLAASIDAGLEKSRSLGRDLESKLG